MAKIDGTSADDRLIGTAGSDEIDGGAGRDRLNGGDGDDVMRGGADNDYVYGDGGNDTLYGGEGNDALVGHSGDDIIYGENGNDGVFGGGGHDRIYGGEGTDTLYGDGGDDVIDGGAGDDRIFGGSGNDTLVYTAGSGNDTFVGNTGIDTVRIEMTSADLDLARSDFQDFASWIDGQLADAGGTAGHAGRNTGAEFTFGSLGLTVSGIEDVEIIVDGAEVPLADLLNSSPIAAATQTLALAEDASVHGAVNASDPDGDTLNCTVSEDPANGVCVLDEHTGEFTYTPNENFSGVDTFTILIDDGRGGTSQQRVTVEVDPTADTPTLVAAVAEVSDGNIAGNDGDEELAGGSGSDNISGGDGNDTIYADGAASGVSVALDIQAALTDGDGSETLTLTIGGVPDGASLSAGTDQGNGVWQLGQNDLAGLTLNMSEAGSVRLEVTATATESDGSTSSATQFLDITANDLGGDDVISGGAGNDVIYGGEGTDIIDFSDTQNGVWVDLGWGYASGEGFDLFDSIEGVNGSEYGDALFGSNGDDIFNGGGGGDAIYAYDGNDRIDGGAGSDSLYGYNGDDTITGGSDNDYIDGGAGNDTASYAGASSGVDVNLGRGQASGGDGNDRLNSIENVVGSAFADELMGSRDDNVIDGGDGNDQIRSDRGADILTGGAGNDTFEFRRNDVAQGNNHHGVDRITDFGAGDRLDFDDMLRGVRYDDLSEVVRLTETTEGTMVSVDMRGISGFTDVVFLEGVFDLDLDYLDGSGQLIV